MRYNLHTAAASLGKWPLIQKQLSNDFICNTIKRSTATRCQCPPCGVPTIRMNNGVDIPVFGLGTWKLMPESRADRALKKKLKRIESRAIRTPIPKRSPYGMVGSAVEAALDAGYTHIDCAPAYENESEIGEVLCDKLCSREVLRENLFITSKLWNNAHHPCSVECALRTTLRDLRLTYLDLYLIHWPQGYQDGPELIPQDDSGKTIYSEVDYCDTWRAMEYVYDMGLTRAIGISNFNKSQIERILKICKARPALNQIEVHPYLNQQRLITYCREQGITVLGYSPLGSPDRENKKPEEPVLLEEQLIKSIAQKYKKTPAQICIRYGIDRGLIVLAKSATPSRVAENVNVFDFQLHKEDMQAIACLERNLRFCTLNDSDHKYYPFHDEI